MNAKCKGKTLNGEQVQTLQQFIDNNHKMGIPICSCDVEKVLNMYEKECSKILVTMDNVQFIALQNIIVTYKTGQKVEYSTQDVRKLYLNKDEVRDIQEKQRHLREK